MKNKIIKLSAIALFGATLVSCGGGSGSSSSDPALMDANFRDANVVGLGYNSTSTGSSLTGENGAFSCKSGETVSFFIGKLDFGSTSCKALVTPADVVGGGNATSNASLNMVRLLNSFDNGLDDGEIKISSTLTATLADYTGTFTVESFNTATASFAPITEINTFLNNASAGITLTALISSATAKTHIENTVKCAYSGAFRETNPPNDGKGYGFYYLRPDVSYITTIHDNNVLTATFDVLTTKSFTVDGVSGEVKNVNTIIDEYYTGDEGYFARIGSDNNAKLRFTGHTANKKVLALDVDIDNKVKAYVLGGLDSQYLVGNYNTSTGAISATASGYTLTATVNTSTFVASNTLWDYGTGTASFTAVGCELNK